jgi:2-isopropylmalate synthase
MNSIHILDATLREGQQAPGVLFSAEECCEIALGLMAVGVDTIECGHPMASLTQQESAKRLAALPAHPPILCHARCRREDILTVAQCGAEWVGLFLGLNPMSRATRLGGKSEDQLLAMLQDSIRYAHQLGLKVRYTLEDGSRTDGMLRHRTFEAAVEAGADRICLADTVGILEPDEVKEIATELRDGFPDVPLEVHLHDDRGLSTANALAAIDSGATWVSCSVNGLGERCGITDLIQLLANLHFRGARPLQDPGALQDLSCLVARLSRSPLDARRPVTGKHAFHHSAHSHRKATAVESLAYSWLDPESVGRMHSMDVPISPRSTD